MAAKQTETVPKVMQAKFDSIAAITDEFARVYLDDDYAQVIRYAIAALCRKRPSPLLKGRDKTWACGITHAIGMANFLYDPSQAPHVKARDLYAAFGVAQSTGQSKSKLVRDLLKIYQLDPNWAVPSLLAQLPAFLAPMPPVNDMASMLVEMFNSVEAIETPEGFAISSAPSRSISMADMLAERQQISNPANALYTMEVALIAGLVTDEFLEANPVICRTIEIRGRQTLADLHRIIFTAFERFDEHMYEFQVGGDRFHDPNALRYVLPFAMNDPDPISTPAGDVNSTTIDDLHLSDGEPFGYWFDFGDDWFHQVTVQSIAAKAPKGKYPRVTVREGASPPQYPDFDD
ncbi:MAG: plasmid pRiA4b ORF-3 family protein [Cyanobacteria bacterium P01_D01_bin.123]